MTENELKKKLEEELGEMTPPADEKILSQPIVARSAQAGAKGSENQRGEKSAGRRPFRLSKRTRGCIASVAAAAAIALCVLLGVFFLPVSMPQSSYATVVVQINPSAGFVVDAENKVVGVSSLNADADILLADEVFLDSLTGVPVEEAVTAFAVRAKESGFLTDGGKVSVSAAARDDKRGDGLIESVEKKLNEVFSEVDFSFSFEGVAAGMEQVCALFGVQAQSIGELVEKVRSTPLYTFEREIAGLNGEELAALYEERVSHGLYKNTISGLLQDCYERAQALEEMAACNEEIMEDAENPAILAKDYWSVLRIYDDADMSASFLAKMQGMRELIASYAERFGASMDSYAVFLSEKILYGGISSASEQIASWLADFTDYLFDLQLDYILTLLDDVLADFTEELSALYDKGMPENTAEYIAQTKEACRLFGVYLTGGAQA